MDELKRLEREVNDLQNQLRRQNEQAERARQNMINENRRNLENYQAEMQRAIREHDAAAQAEYERLLEKADPDRKPVRKQRWVVDYHGQRFEIDLFPFWKKQAYLELELRDEDQKIEFPPALDVIREVTGDARYTNRALARAIPDEDE